MENEEYRNRKSRKQRREAEVSILITITITIIIIIITTITVVTVKEPYPLIGESPVGTFADVALPQPPIPCGQLLGIMMHCCPPITAPSTYHHDEDEDTDRICSV